MDVSRQPPLIIGKGRSDKPVKLLPKYEIIAEQYNLIRTWKPQSDVWPLTIGRNILIGATMATGIYINHRFRAKLKLRDFGVFATMLGLSVTPAAVAAICHTEYIMNKLLLLEVPCAMCMESTAALAQTCSGLFFPLILAPLANFSVAAGSGVYNVPYVKDVRKVFQTVLSVYRPMFPKIVMLFTLHALLAGFITYLEIKSYIRLLDLQYLKQEAEGRFK